MLMMACIRVGCCGNDEIAGLRLAERCRGEIEMGTGHEARQVSPS